MPAHKKVLRATQPVSIRARAAVLVTGLVALAAAGYACDGGAGAGARCSQSSDCQSELQCLQEVCVPRCVQNADCGDGNRCTSGGRCEQVVSSIGDRCASEWDCGPGQGCVLDEDDPDNDQRLAATCQAQGVGSSVGSKCAADSDCRNSLCSLGHCSQLCEVNSDCPAGTGCEWIPRIIENDSALFLGCLQSTGVLSTRIEMTSPAERLRIPVPSSARSLTVVSQVNDAVHFVGATRVVSPSGDLLFNGATSLEDLLANPIRYFRQRKISTLMIPNRAGATPSDDVEIQTGIYQIDIAATLPPFGPGTAIPEVQVFYKLDTSRKLDLHFYFLDLDEHPCQQQLGISTLDGTPVDTIDETTAPSSQGFQAYLSELKTILSSGDIQVMSTHYKDIDRADLDGIVGNDLDDLFRLADNESGMAIFFVRSLSPDGVQAQTGGTPGPPRMPKTSASGIAISVDTLCYRSWEALARVTAHSIAGQMGLWNNRDPEGSPDPISDTDGSTDNLMFFGEFGGINLSPGQKRVLGRYPGLR